MSTNVANGVAKIDLAAVLAAVKASPELAKELRKLIGAAGVITLTAEQGSSLKAYAAKEDGNPGLMGDIEFTGKDGARYFAKNVKLGKVREGEVAAKHREAQKAKWAAAKSGKAVQVAPVVAKPVVDEAAVMELLASLTK